MLSDEEKKDILFQIDMQLYDEFNDKIATMNDYLGDIYSLRDIEEVEKAEKEKEIKLLRQAIEKQSKEIEELNKSDASKEQSSMKYYNLYKELVDKIKAKIEDLESQINDIKSNFDYEYDECMVNEVWRLENKIDVLQSLLEKE